MNRTIEGGAGVRFRFDPQPSRGVHSNPPASLIEGALSVTKVESLTSFTFSLHNYVIYILGVVLVRIMHFHKFQGVGRIGIWNDMYNIYRIQKDLLC